MKKFINISLAILLLNLFACKQVEEIPSPDAVPQTNVEKPVWNPPAQLTGDLDADMKILEELSDESFYDGSAEKRGSIVFLNAGSSNELQAKVNAAGNGGVVIVRSGAHHESGTVTITKKVAIIGMPGAEIVSETKIFGPVPGAVPNIQPVLHVLGANRTWISGLSFVPSSGPLDGGTAILVENSHHVVMALNNVDGFQFGVLLENANYNKMLGNNIDNVGVHGITVINGHHAVVKLNQVANATFGVWACDKYGTYQNNNTHDNFIGLILCNVPPNAFPLPGGNFAGSQFPGAFWNVKNNNSWNNLTVGYIVIDGANNNTLRNNNGSGNGTYDIELVGDSERFGFFTPKSFDNTVNAGPYNVLIKDCGDNNTVIGGNQVDTSVDLCTLL